MKSALCLFLCLFAPFSTAAEIHVAVASNFLATFKNLKPQFEGLTGHRLLISSGSTGKLYAQILHGAPYDLLLAADVERPQALIKSGHAVAPDCFVYARGQLVLWSKHTMTSGSLEEALRDHSVKRIAIANPATAPYGLAAQTYLQQQGLWQAVQPRLVKGESVGQAFQFVASGNAQLGFIALPYVMQWQQQFEGGQYWPVPFTGNSSLEQCGVILKRAKDRQAVNALVSFLLNDKSQAMIQTAGYRAE